MNITAPHPTSAFNPGTQLKGKVDLCLASKTLPAILKMKEVIDTIPSKHHKFLEDMFSRAEKAQYNKDNNISEPVYISARQNVYLWGLMSNYYVEPPKSALDIMKEREERLKKRRMVWQKKDGEGEG